MDVFESSPDLKAYFDNAYGYAVFPTVGRGGIVVGGSYGNGQVYEKGKVAGHVSLAKLSIGFQLGGQVFSEIIFLQDKRAFDEFISNRFEFDASLRRQLSLCLVPRRRPVPQVLQPVQD